MIIPSLISRTGIGVALVSKLASWLGWLGSRCCTKTKAMPVLPGRCVSSWVNASKPPADAPTPTMQGKQCLQGNFLVSRISRKLISLSVLF